MLFGLGVLGRRLFLPPDLGRLRSEVRLRQKLGLGWGIQLVLLFDGLLLEGGIGLGLSLVWELCMSQSRGLHSQYTRNFSITDDLLL